MTEIEIPDQPDGPRAGGEPEAPYGNLFVPLLVVPAMIVIVLVLVWVLFGAIAGDEAGPRDNLRTMVHGGANEREQASFNLVRQVLEDWQAVEAGEDPPWGIDARYVPDVQRAWEQTDEDEYDARYVLAILLARLGDEAGEEHLVELLAMPEDADPDGQKRFFVLQALGTLGNSEHAPAVIEFLDHPDQGLQHMAIGALQSMPGEATLAALRGLLEDGDLELRGQAAVSLARLGDPAGAAVLRELIDPATYELDRKLDEARWARAQEVSAARRTATLGLGGLGREEDRAFLRELAEEDADPEVREAALRALRAVAEQAAEPAPTGETE